MKDMAAVYWLSARLQYPQCVSIGDTAVLHKAIDLGSQWFVCNLYVIHQQLYKLTAAIWKIEYIYIYIYIAYTYMHYFPGS